MHKPVRITEALGDGGGFEERFAVGGVAGLALRGTETDEQVAMPDLVVIGLVVQVDRLHEPAERVRRREPDKGLLARHLGELE